MKIFILWIKLLYLAPVASVITNDLHSAFFPLKRGMKQGCPLSPLLFAIAIEPLAIWLCSEERFEGIVRGRITHKVSLYADDLLLYISNPSSSIPIIMSILEQFGSLSGCKLDFLKSEVFPINPMATRLPHLLFPFKQMDRGFKLGIFS